MRRLLAITMTMLLGFALAAPLFIVDASASLPACCRRNGRHHCAAGMAFDSGSGNTISTIAPRCPAIPKALAFPSQVNFAPPKTQSTSIAVFAHPASAPQTEARYRVSFTRSRQKRGPPLDLL